MKCLSALLLFFGGLPLPAAASLALGPAIRSTTGAGAMAAPVAMAWAVSLSKPLRGLNHETTFSDLKGCLFGLSQLDLKKPEHWETLSPVVARLDETGLRPAEFSTLSDRRKRELLVQAVELVAEDKRAQAAKLIFHVGKGAIAGEELESVERDGKELKRDALFLTDVQNEGVRAILRRAAHQQAVERAKRTIALAEKIGRELAGASKDDAGVQAETVLRTVIAPDGRKVRFVRRGTRYRVWYEGDDRPAAEYDLQDTDGNEITAFTVTRGRRRGLHLNGTVLWEDGVY